MGNHRSSVSMTPSLNRGNTSPSPNARNTSSPAVPRPQQSPAPRTGNNPGGGSAPNTANTPAHVQCPACSRTLIQPNAPQFYCPCGQLLQRPQPLRVRCPRCSAILEPPLNARVFACRCGLHLRAPESVTNRGAALPPNFNRDGPEGRSFLMNESVMLKITNAGAMGQWKRRSLGDDKIGWYKTFSEEEDAAVLDAEEAAKSAFDLEAIKKCSVNHLRDRLAVLGISYKDCIEKDDLYKRVLGALDILKTSYKVEQLKEKLQILGVDYKSCVSVEDLANRLFFHVWTEKQTTSAVKFNGFVRQLTFNDKLEWFPAISFSISTKLEAEFSRSNQYTSNAILLVSLQSYRQKCEWVKQQLKNIRIKWEEGHVKMKIRRSHLLEDSFNNFKKLKEEDFRRDFRFEFINESGLDAGGVAREWFTLVTDLCFNIDFGLFEYGGTDNLCYQISPLSGHANDLHLEYFHFLGLVMGKALFDGHLFPPHMTRVFYKHILAWPVTESDVEFVDSQVSNSIKQVRECEDVSVLCLDFTTAFSVFGENVTVELKPGGKDIEVNNSNRDEYLELLVKHITLNNVSKQMRQFLNGFYTIIPLPILSVFNFSELEFLLCGLPDINVQDWMAHTKYKGEYATLGANHPTIKIFWEIINSWSQEQRARFLQFATGTSRVPVQGFGALCGKDGEIKPFTIESVSLNDTVFPRAHTCFNRIDLPCYSSKQDMAWRFGQAMDLEGTGFGIE